MTEFRDRTFEDERIYVEGQTFTGCTFRRCRFVFTGVALTHHMTANTIEGFSVEFEGPALNTVGFLQGLYATGGEERAFVEDVIDAIQSGRPLDRPGDDLDS